MIKDNDLNDTATTPTTNNHINNNYNNIQQSQAIIVAAEEQHRNIQKRKLFGSPRPARAKRERHQDRLRMTLAHAHLLRIHRSPPARQWRVQKDGQQMPDK